MASVDRSLQDLTNFFFAETGGFHLRDHFLAAFLAAFLKADLTADLFVQAFDLFFCKTTQYRTYHPVRLLFQNIGQDVLLNTFRNSFGCGFSEGYGNDFDITKLRYDKIILMTDADVDGSHIDTLLLTFLYRFMPDLITEGHVYVSMPPLYQAIPHNKKEQSEYLYDESALTKYQKNHKAGTYDLKRFKGLGEMNPEQLWETTLNPENRVLKRVEIEDGRLASEVTSMLMGSEVGPRRDFIHDHADEAVIDA